MTTQHHGYSGNNYDRWVERNSNSSALGKVQKQFWFTKSAVIRKFGKREDEYIVASDAELDSKIDLFKAIESSTRELQILLADYQNRICILAQEENTLGRLLKEYGKQDQTRAGKMMMAVGKSLSYTAQQRVALRNPLVRLFQEVDTFQTRAVEDTSHTVEEMEKVRTEYRGALMWMKNISKDFNPDHYQQLEKFREVQTTVKTKKSKFDQIKIKSLQKIELLAASRCNMFSHALILYQNNLITFSEKTAKTLNSVASNFKGYHPYKFHVIKELAEPEGLQEEEEENDEADLDGDDKTYFDAEYHDEDKQKGEGKKSKLANNRASKCKKQEAKLGKHSDSLVNLFNNDDNDQFMLLQNQIPTKGGAKSATTSFASVDLLSGNIAPVESAQSTTEMLKELFDSPVHESPNQSLPVFGSEDLNCADPAASSQNTSFDLFSKSYMSENNPSSGQMFMPSQLLDFGLKEFESQKLNAGLVESPTNPFSFLNDATALSLEGKSLLPPAAPLTSNFPQKGSDETVNQISQETASSKHPKQDATKLDWYKVFQDIDPLADPGSAIFGKGFADKKC